MRFPSRVLASPFQVAQASLGSSRPQVLARLLLENNVKLAVGRPCQCSEEEVLSVGHPVWTSWQIRLKVEELSGVSRELPRGGKRLEPGAGSPPLDQLRISLKPGAGAESDADSSRETRATSEGPQYVRMVPNDHLIMIPNDHLIIWDPLIWDPLIMPVR